VEQIEVAIGINCTLVIIDTDERNTQHHYSIPANGASDPAL